MTFPGEHIPLTADSMDAAFRAAVLRQDLDKLLAQHGAQLVLGWHGAHAKLQIQFSGVHGLAVTICSVRRGGRIRYMTEVEECSSKP